MSSIIVRSHPNPRHPTDNPQAVPGQPKTAKRTKDQRSNRSTVKRANELNIPHSAFPNPHSTLLNPLSSILNRYLIRDAGIGELEPEPGAAALGALDVRVLAVGLKDLFDDAEAEARAAAVA